MSKRFFSVSLILAIAAAAHGVNAAYCRSLGDTTQPSWDDAPEWQRDSAMQGVQFHIDNPDASDSASHENWMAQKVADGWVFGEQKNARKKTHPCIVPFDQLPAEQQAKDALFRSVVRGIVDRYDDDRPEQVDISSFEARIHDINNALQPLAAYLQAGKWLDENGNGTLTIRDICDAAVIAMQAVDASNTELQAKIVELTPEPDATSSKKQKLIAVSASIDDEQYQSATTVIFANTAGHVINELAPLSFTTDKFVGDARGRTLNADIEFPVHLPAREVAAVFLVDAKGEAVSLSQMVQPLSVCGGRSARINSGSLLFRLPEKQKDKAA